MEINKKNRTELKSYFLANKIPTQRDFEDFIDAQLNQAEDGIAKVQGSPIALEAEGDSGGPQEVLNLYASFADANPSWGISLNPRVDPAVPGSNKPGLNFKDTTGASRLYIKSAGGEIGIGTIEPTSKLSIKAKEDASMISVTSGSSGTAHIFEVAQENSNGVLSVRGGNGSLVSRLSGAASKPSFFLSKVGIGTDMPTAQLHVSGDDTELKITDNKTGGLPRLSLDSKNGQSWWVQGGETFQVTADRSDDGALRLEKDGHLKLSGGFTVGASSTDLNGDGSFYRKGSGTFLTIDDHFYFRHPSKGNQVHIKTNEGRMAIGGTEPDAPLSISGGGKFRNPDGRMHIGNGFILFGGKNGPGEQPDSAQISAGMHLDNSLNIIGMSKGDDVRTRKIDIWAEGGMRVRGHVISAKAYVAAFSVSLSVNMTGAKNPLQFGQVNYNEGNHFRDNTHFIAPVTGMYLFAMCMRNNTSNDVGWRLRLNDTGFVHGFDGIEHSERSMLIAKVEFHMNSRTVITKLNAGDKVHVEQFGSGGNDNHASGFDGMLLQAFE